MSSHKKKFQIIEGGNRNSLNDMPVQETDMDMDETEIVKQLGMQAMAEMGVTAEEYATFLASGIGRDEVMENIHKMIGDDKRPGGCMPYCQAMAAMPDAENKSLKLKIQMKDVVKPPMWREVIIPADFNFSQLHYVIQAVTGLEDCHLWQFQDRQIQSTFEIAIPQDGQFGFGVTECTHHADTTPVTGVLREKGNKVEYWYDFGDDWMFTVSVLAVMDRQGEVPEMTKWKSDLQPIEDTGGAWNYPVLRDAALDKMSDKDLKHWADNYCFERVSDFKDWLAEHMIAPEDVADGLADIPDSFIAPEF